MPHTALEKKSTFLEHQLSAPVIVVVSDDQCLEIWAKNGVPICIPYSCHLRIIWLKTGGKWPFLLFYFGHQKLPIALFGKLTWQKVHSGMVVM